MDYIEVANLDTAELQPMRMGHVERKSDPSRQRRVASSWPNPKSCGVRGNIPKTSPQRFMKVSWLF